MSSEFDSSQMSETELEVASEVTITRSRKARKIIITAGAWKHSRQPKDGEPKKRNGALILYCKYCEDYGVTGTTSFRYLKSKHGITVEPKPMITHKGSEQSVLIASVLGEYDILKKLGYVIGDNHGSDDTLCRSLQLHLLEKEIEWDAATQRIRCIGHI
jgi:hypothetical protein